MNPKTTTVFSKTKHVSTRKANNRSSRAKALLFRFGILSIAMVAAIIALTAVLDPLQFYRKATWYKPFLSSDARYQNPGLAKNYDYDIIIIGTSMTQNFLPSEVGQALDGTAMKLAIEGSTADEHYYTAKLALETGKIKKILWGLDYFSLKANTKQASEQFPAYMYDEVWWNDYKYLFNYSVYDQLFKSLYGRMLGNKGRELEYLNNWNNRAVFGAGEVMKSYDKASQRDVYFGINEESLDVVQKSFTDHILSLVKAYPEVEFYFYYPPYSILRQTMWYESNPARFDNQIAMRKWMFEQLEAQGHVKLYDFQSESDWTYNLDLYKDLSHHKQDVNSWIAEAIGQDDSRYRVTADNIDKLNDKLKEDTLHAMVTPEPGVRNMVAVISGEKTMFTSRAWAGRRDLMVPVKEAVKALDAKWSWDKSTRTMQLSKDGHKVQMTVGSTEAVTPSGTHNIEYPPQLIGGSTMIPLVWVAEQLGWHADIEEDAYETQINLKSM
ncbi:copper amine oxidase N-terminal domain-containing protein [Paenibacillus dakarensis]|uniref:copper amine oxidase N-terminal domain-containing protein n=1 Tax=Paenibacillus dakarensis TaxID=1527293 RepID=UPI0006D58D0C|nr:copper amine oxidase N-terminal domain-containing protein [Paenibacillus dakarensis]